MNQTSLTILIADDDEGDRIQLKRTLFQSGLKYVCIEVSDLVEALKECDKIMFDCMIIDYQLPGQDGLKGISMMHTQFPEMAIIMSTGQGDEMVATEAFKRGASDYIVKKNLSPELLKKSITTAIEKCQLQRQLRQKEAAIKHLAHHDHLTSIPNRLFFDQSLSETLLYAKQHNTMFAIMFLDLDQFKYINDSFGHEMGDLLLQKVSHRFQSMMRKGDILARLGGDEFGILLESITELDNAAFCAKKILNLLNDCFSLENEKINITASIGIAVYPLNGQTVSDLMRSADKAMYQAKNAGRNNFQFYTSRH